MYDKKQALGFILIIMVVMTYTQFAFAPYQQPTETRPGNIEQTNQNNADLAPLNQPSVPPVLTASANATGQGIQPTSALKIPSLAEIEAAPKSVVKTGVATIVISHLGARISKFELDSVHKSLGSKESLDIVNAHEGIPLPGGLFATSFNDEGLRYEAESQSGFSKNSDGSLFPNSDTEAQIVFSANSPSGKVVKKIIRFKLNSYLFSLQATVQPPLPSNEPLSVAWPIKVESETLHQRFDPYFFSTLNAENRSTHVMAVSDLKSLHSQQNAQWLAFGDRYFNTVLIPQNEPKLVKVESAPDTFVLYALGSSSDVNVGIFAGPKDYKILKSFGLQLERTIDLGFFSFVAFPLLQLLKFFYSIFGNYGVAIVALTLLVKTVFYPLNKASLKSTRGMQELAPEIAALRERVKDPTQLNQEMLALYKRKGVNPVGGCLPVFIQIPVFFGLYSALQNVVELRHAPFALWVKDLASPERVEVMGVNFPIMVLLMGAIMFIQQYRTPMPNMDPTQRKIMLGMSLLFTGMFLIYPFPAGLALYMLVNTTISLVQQSCIRSETMNKPFQMTLLASVAILAAAHILAKV